MELNMVAEDVPLKRYTMRKNDRDLPRITKVMSYDNTNGVNLQIIRIDKDHDNFIENFDFDICKNIYYPNKKLYIHDIENILNKRTTFNATFNLRLSIARYYKYINYGLRSLKKI